MSKFKLACLVAALAAACISAPGHAARDLWMSDAEIIAQFNDATIDGSYAAGRPFVESYLADGRVEYVERGLTMRGYWSVTAGTLCTIYDLDPTGGCFRVARVAENCFEFYFASRTEQAAPGPEGAQPAWTARGSIRGKDASCPERADV